MGKASSKKKIARAARAGGGSRARSAGERSVLFPLSLSLVVVLGIALVVFARADRRDDLLTEPISNVDHWHSALSMEVCGEPVGEQPEFANPVGAGTHTHGDGLIHIHPFSESRSGDNATLANYFEDARMTLEDDRVEFWTGEELVEGEDDCDGEDAIVQVAYFDRAAVAAGEDASPVIIDDNLDDIRFLGDGEAFVVAFAPEGSEFELPPSVSGLSAVSPTDLGAGEEDAGDSVDADEDTGSELPDATDETDATEGADETDDTDDTGTDDTDDAGTDDTDEDPDTDDTTADDQDQ